MQKASWIGLRLLGALALLALVDTTNSSLISAVAGRDYSRCVQACNETRHSCDDRCVVDCANLFPTDKTARQACVSTCQSGCTEEWSGCRDICEEKKDVSPIEP